LSCFPRRAFVGFDADSASSPRFFPALLDFIVIFSTLASSLNVARVA
jgi:hypothetical protein